MCVCLSPPLKVLIVHIQEFTLKYINETSFNPPPTKAHLCQPLLTFSIAGGNQHLFGLFDEQR